MPRISEALSELAREFAETWTRREDASLATREPPVESPESGDYVTDGSSLYYVERLYDGQALVEDCRNARLINFPITELRSLEIVERSCVG